MQQPAPSLTKSPVLAVLLPTMEELEACEDQAYLLAKNNCYVAFRYRNEVSTMKMSLMDIGGRKVVTQTMGAPVSGGVIYQGIFKGQRFETRKITTWPKVRVK